MFYKMHDIKKLSNAHKQCNIELFHLELRNSEKSDLISSGNFYLSHESFQNLQSHTVFGVFKNRPNIYLNSQKNVD